MFGSRMRDVDASGSTAGEMPSSVSARLSTVVASRRAKAVAGGAGGGGRGGPGARLREAEDVVDEEQHVLALLVTEVLRGGEAREADAQARPRRLGRLADDARRLLDDARLLHLVVEVVAP